MTPLPNFDVTMMPILDGRDLKGMGMHLFVPFKDEIWERYRKKAEDLKADGGMTVQQAFDLFSVPLKDYTVFCVTTEGEFWEWDKVVARSHVEGHLFREQMLRSVVMVSQAASPLLSTSAVMPMAIKPQEIYETIIGPERARPEVRIVQVSTTGEEIWQQQYAQPILGGGEKRFWRDIPKVRVETYEDRFGQGTPIIKN